jgi:sugar fermentation stimulation protein A
MQFDPPLVRARLVKRYKRFLADAVLDDGTAVTAHCPNTGSMLGVCAPGSTVWLARKPGGKLGWGWELVEDATQAAPTLVGINPLNPNRLAEEAIRAGRIAELAGYPALRREVRYGRENSRIDLLAEAPDRPACYIEIKNVHLRRTPGLAEFPDSVTRRGAKHLRELAQMVQMGQRAVMFFLVQRQDCARFAVAADIDPAYAAALGEARSRGVETICYGCRITPAEIAVDGPLALAL